MKHVGNVDTSFFTPHTINKQYVLQFTATRFPYIFQFFTLPKTFENQILIDNKFHLKRK